MLRETEVSRSTLSTVWGLYFINTILIFALKILKGVKMGKAKEGVKK